MWPLRPFTDPRGETLARPAVGMSKPSDAPSYFCRPELDRNRPRFGRERGLAVPIDGLRPFACAVPSSQDKPTVTRDRLLGFFGPAREIASPVSLPQFQKLSPWFLTATPIKISKAC